jgi:hypothetical protein
MLIGVANAFETKRNEPEMMTGHAMIDKYKNIINQTYNKKEKTRIESIVRLIRCFRIDRCAPTSANRNRIENENRKKS